MDCQSARIRMRVCVSPQRTSYLCINVDSFLFDIVFIGVIAWYTMRLLLFFSLPMALAFFLLLTHSHEMPKNLIKHILKFVDPSTNAICSDLQLWLLMVMPQMPQIPYTISIRIEGA